MPLGAGVGSLELRRISPGVTWLPVCSWDVRLAVASPVGGLEQDPCCWFPQLSCAPIFRRLKGMGRASLVACEVCGEVQASVAALYVYLRLLARVYIHLSRDF